MDDPIAYERYILLRTQEHARCAHHHEQWARGYGSSEYKAIRAWLGTDSRTREAYWNVAQHVWQRSGMPARPRIWEWRLWAVAHAAEAEWAGRQTPGALWAGDRRKQGVTDWTTEYVVAHKWRLAYIWGDTSTAQEWEREAHGLRITSSAGLAEMEAALLWVRLHWVEIEAEAARLLMTHTAFFAVQCGRIVARIHGVDLGPFVAAVGDEAACQAGVPSMEGRLACMDHRDHCSFGDSPAGWAALTRLVAAYRLTEGDCRESSSVDFCDEDGMPRGWARWIIDAAFTPEHPLTVEVRDEYLADLAVRLAEEAREQAHEDNIDALMEETEG